MTTLACLLALAPNFTAPMAQDVGVDETPVPFEAPEKVSMRAHEPTARSVGLALSDDTLWVAYRQMARQGVGYGEVSFLGNSDDDYLINGRVMRLGRPESQVPLELGVGVGVYGAILDEVDAEAFALALTGAARYHANWSYPTTFGVEVSFAPDVATFGDGERVLDVLARSEVELSPYASAFVGFRYVEIDLEGGGDRELDDGVHFGVRLAL